MLKTSLLRIAVNEARSAPKQEQPLQCFLHGLACLRYARTAKVARRYVSLAQETLRVLPPSQYRNSLHDLADYALTRER